MSDFFLDLRDKPRVVDFLVEAGAYASPKNRVAAEKLVTAYTKGEKMPTDTLANAARTLAVATWPARYALQHHLTKENPEEEWRLVTSAVRPSTAHLLKRFRASVKTKTLDETLNHSDSAMTIRDEETLEIGGVRTHAREHYWKENGKALAARVKEGTRLLATYRKGLDKLREIASTVPSALQDEIFSKISHYEDRIFFAGEAMPMEVLEQEIRYYTDQKEISPLE